MYEFDMSGLELFTGGPLDTNAYFLETPVGNVLFDAPQGADAHFAGRKVDWLILTHGHFDHTADAAGIRRRHGCRIGFHEETTPMVRDRDFFRRFGFGLEIEPFDADFLIGEGDVNGVAGLAMQALFVPGHCPGSLCFFLRDRGIVIGGDVLFRGGVGRWDLPGGDGPLLFEGIRSKLFALPSGTVVLPGHGPATTIGEEKATNPYVAG